MKNAMIVVLLLSSVGWAKNVNPSDFTLNAHFVSAENEPNGVTYRGNHARLNTVSVAHVRIGSVLYEIEATGFFTSPCRYTSIGSDYPARLITPNKMELLLPGGKVCKTRIRAAEEIK